MVGSDKGSCVRVGLFLLLRRENKIWVLGWTLISVLFGWVLILFFTAVGKGLSGVTVSFSLPFSTRKQCWHYSQDHWSVPLQGRQQLWLCAERLVVPPVKIRSRGGKWEKEEGEWQKPQLSSQRMSWRGSPAASKDCWLLNLGQWFYWQAVSAVMW